MNRVLTLSSILVLILIAGNYYYAFALSRAGSDDSSPITAYPSVITVRIREELKKAIALRPDYPESYNLLTFVNLVSGTELDESIVMLKRVLEAAPGRSDVRFNLAQIYLRKGEYKSAREIAERLSRNASEAEIRQRAETMLTQITKMEEQTVGLEALRKRRNDSREPFSKAPSVEGNVITERQTPIDPSRYLREALRKPASGEVQAQGTLLQIDCHAKEIIFSIKVGERVLKLKTDSFDNLEIVAFTSDAGTEIGCGPRQAQNSVIICYLPSAPEQAKIDGFLKSIDFVPRDFQLRPRS